MVSICLLPTLETGDSLYCTSSSAPPHVLCEPARESGLIKQQVLCVYRGLLHREHLCKWRPSCACQLKKQMGTQRDDMCIDMWRVLKQFTFMLAANFVWAQSRCSICSLYHICLSLSSQQILTYQHVHGCSIGSQQQPQLSLP